jgi:hypothetical protein
VGALLIQVQVLPVVKEVLAKDELVEVDSVGLKENSFILEMVSVVLHSPHTCGKKTDAMLPS